MLAINRHGVNLLSKLSNVKLRFGDVLLLQGNREHVESLAAEDQILLLEEISRRQVRHIKNAVGAARFRRISVLFAHSPGALAGGGSAGVLDSPGTRSLRTSEIYEMIEWRLIILIACMISFGLAMEKTGADQYLADLIVRGTGHYGPLAVLAGFFIMTVALTQPMSNQAAALVMLPIAVKTALVLGLNPADLCSSSHLCSVMFLSNATGAGLRFGLHTRTLSLL